jgi:hypothetical protein
MNQISEMDDELCPEYDFTQLTIIDRGQKRKKTSLTEQSNPKDRSDGWTEEDRMLPIFRCSMQSLFSNK